MKLIEQIKKGESKTLELKAALPKNENIAKTVIAFSNTSGGKLIIGVNDKPSGKTTTANDYDRLRSITIEKQPGLNIKQPEMQPESVVVQPEWQQELQQGLKDLLEPGLEYEQQELQQESLFTIALSKMLHAHKSRKEISVELGQKAISGQLNEILGKLQKKNLVEWTIPDKPQSSKQKFKLTKRGLAFYTLVRKDGGK